MTREEMNDKIVELLEETESTDNTVVFNDRAQAQEKIYTYPEMNETIKDLLRRSEEPMNLYILARIEELEQENAELKKMKVQQRQTRNLKEMSKTCLST